MTAPLGHVIAWKTGGVAQATVVGGEIVSWSHPTIPEPDAATLEAWRDELAAYEAARAHRPYRAAAYAGFVLGFEGLGEDRDVIKTLGDVVDDLIDQVEANRVAAGADKTDAFALLLTRRAAIKAAFPAPE